MAVNLNIDFNKLFRRTIPHFLRSTKLLEFVGSWANDLDNLNTQLKDFQTTISDKLKYTGQKIYLERYLNDTYDDALRRIYIENQETTIPFFARNKAEARRPKYIFNKIEAKPPTYLFNKGERASEFDYIVFIPNSIIFDLDLITSQILVYNPAGRRFKIETF